MALYNIPAEARSLAKGIMIKKQNKQSNPVAKLVTESDGYSEHRRGFLLAGILPDICVYISFADIRNGYVPLVKADERIAVIHQHNNTMPITPVNHHADDHAYGFDDLMETKEAAAMLNCTTAQPLQSDNRPDQATHCLAMTEHTIHRRPSLEGVVLSASVMPQPTLQHQPRIYYSQPVTMATSTSVASFDAAVPMEASVEVVNSMPSAVRMTASEMLSPVIPSAVVPVTPDQPQASAVTPLAASDDPSPCTKMKATRKPRAPKPKSKPVSC